jgi:hypothetical protein
MSNSSSWSEHRDELLLRLDAEPPDRPVGGPVEEADERSQHAADEEHRSGQRIRGRPGLGDGDRLRHQLPHHHRDEGGQQKGDGDRDAGCSSLPYHVTDQWFEGRGDGGLGDEADDQRGDGDPELGAREVERQPAERPLCAAGGPAAGGGVELHPISVDGDQRELDRDEEAVGEDQQEDGDEAEGGFDEGVPEEIGPVESRGQQ